MQFFLLFSMVTELHIQVYICFSHINMLYHEWLDIVSGKFLSIWNEFAHLVLTIVYPEGY